MEATISALSAFHVAISILLIVFILLQFGKGAEAGLFSQESGAIFSSAQSGNILTKITTVLAILFLTLSIGLATLRSKTSSTSELDGEVDKTAAPISSDLEKNSAEADAEKSEDGKAEEANGDGIEVEEIKPTDAKPEAPKAQ